MNQISRAAIVFCLSGAVFATAHAAAPMASDAAWTALFNGRNLDGWIAKIKGQPLGHDQAGTFRVENGLLKVRYDGYQRFAGQFGHLFYAHPFSHYALHIQYRFVGEQHPGGPAGWAERNSGVMLHAQAPATMSLAQDFPVSIEAQFLGGLSDGRARPTANVCTPGTDITVNGQTYPRHCLNSTAATFDGDQWVDVTIVVLGGGTITHYVEGKDVLSYQHPRLDRAGAHARPSGASRLLSAGYIALQSESHPIDFKQVRLLNLAGCMDPEADNQQPYFLKSEPDTCVYR